MSPGRCNVVESGGLEEKVRSGSGKVKVGLGGKYIIMAEKTAGEQIQILKKIERGQRTARRGLGGEGERGVFLVFWGYIAEKAISGLGGLATYCTRATAVRCTVYGVGTSSHCVCLYSVPSLVRYGGR